MVPPSYMRSVVDRNATHTCIYIPPLLPATLPELAGRNGYDAA